MELDEDLVHVFEFQQIGRANFLQHLFNNEEYSDVTIKASDSQNRVVHANKCILAAASPVFSRMFYGSFKEASQNEVVIEDCRIEALIPFIRQIYGFYPSQFESLTLEIFREVFELNVRFLVKEEVNNNNCRWLKTKLKHSDNPDILLDLLCIAHKYKLNPLEKDAVKKVMDLMSSSHDMGEIFLKSKNWQQVKQYPELMQSLLMAQLGISPVIFFPRIIVNDLL